MPSDITAFFNSMAGAFPYITMVIRFLLPVLALIIVIRCARSLLREKLQAEEWGYLSLPNGAKIPLNHWENIIGRSRSSDLYMEYPSLSRSHAAVIRDDAGSWKVYDLGAKSGVIVNNRAVKKAAPLKSGDIMVLGGVELVFFSYDQDTEIRQAAARRIPGRTIKPAATLFLVTIFQILLGLQLCISQASSLEISVPVGFAALILMMWVCYIVTRALHRFAFEVETIAFFLSTIGFAITASSSPEFLYKQLLLLAIGILLYFAIGWMLRDLSRAKKLRWTIGWAGLVLLALNVLLSPAVLGARNWLTIPGTGISFQPSEFVKIAFVFAGSATLDRLFTRRNLVLFIVYAGACVIALALISDYGTALIFFVAYLVIAFVRSGNFATIFLSIGGAGLAGFLALSAKAHLAARFATWGKAWEYASAGGFQQTRAMSASASGGLFGVGAGNGWFKTVFAANTDLVFGMISEELGLIIALLAIASVIVLAVFAVRSAATARSSFYIIAASAAAAIFIFQLSLNVLGCMDILPFTGVTFPFVSKGGSSLVACWGLLAFIKAIDTRQNASFIVRLPKGSRRAARTGVMPEPVDMDREEPMDEPMEEID